MARLRPGRRSGAAAAIVAGALLAVYLMLVTYTAIDHYLFPGNELEAPAIPVGLPGTSISVDVALPGVATAGEKPWTPGARLNILVLGLDRRPEDPPGKPARSDTMFIASLDKLNGRLQMLAIPRDLWAEIPYGDKPGVWAPGKINAAHSYGEFYGYPGGGPAAAVAAVEHNFHIDIHHFVSIDWLGFVRLIDAIGGIDIDVPAPVSDYGTDVLDTFSGNTVPAGPQHMTGAQALGYSRVRVDGDIKRIERQQAVIRAVAARAVSFGYIARLPELWDAYHDAIKTDVNTGQVPGYALLAADTNLANIESFSLAGALYSGIAEDGALILLPNNDAMFDIIDLFLSDPRTRGEAPTVAIEYAAGQETAAGAAREHLLAYGVPAEYVQLLKGEGGTPGVFDFTGKSYTAAKLTSLFDLRLLNPDGPAPDGVDVLVRLGESTKMKSP
ncbi:MAG: LCP family protein [Dehalococcoidia bacterium]|nr:LCP family protein [Dehalococcoidia bacterium]MCL4230433.1 LCP family protein [Dehalococcoidia bacterium]NUQ54504.1 LCP family protein [Dehalococcoidia bacterium]